MYKLLFMMGFHICSHIYLQGGPVYIVRNLPDDGLSKIKGSLSDKTWSNLA